MDSLRDDICKNHDQIHIADFDFYDVGVFNRCENGDDILIAVKPWISVHPLLKIIPVEWDHFIPYGLLHSPTPSETVKTVFVSNPDGIARLVQFLLRNSL